jgi:phenylacetate-CoA ligase
MRGNNVRLYTRKLIKSQDKSRDTLEEETAGKLQKLLLHCVEKVPAYKTLGISRDEILADPRAAFSRVPALSKKSFQVSSELYLSEDADKSSLILNKTGGSTGEPVSFFMDRYTVEHYEAARWRGLSWSGITFGSRSVMIWGNPVELEADAQKKAKLKEKYLKNRVIISAYTLSDEKIVGYVSFINRYKPEYIYGYASAVYTFAALIKDNGLKLAFSPKAVVSTSETLHDYQRALTQEVFGCPVVNEYGARDTGIIAYECKMGGMHITVENTYVEILDPVSLLPVPQGKSGLVAATDLNNFSMPRLRYLLGDMAAISDEKCRCGIEHTLISSIDGRQDDMLKLPDGTLVHGHLLNQLSRKYSDSVSRFRLVQNSLSDAELELVLAGEKEKAEGFANDVAAHLPGVDIKVRYVDDIPLTPSGKMRYAIRSFDL